VHDLPAFWKSLSQDAELKLSLAPPPDPEWRWQWPLGLVGGGILLLITGTILWGLLILLAGVAVAFWAHGQYAAEEDALAEWERSLYCRHCAVVFDRVKYELT
jgi:hypothetical protein